MVTSDCPPWGVQAGWSGAVLPAFGLRMRELSTGDSPPESALRSPWPTPWLATFGDNHDGVEPLMDAAPAGSGRGPEPLRGSRRDGRGELGGAIICKAHRSVPGLEGARDSPSAMTEQGA